MRSRKEMSVKLFARTLMFAFGLCLLLGGTAWAYTDLAAETESTRQDSYHFTLDEDGQLILDQPLAIQYVPQTAHTAPPFDTIYEAAPPAPTHYDEPDYLAKTIAIPPVMEDVSLDDWFYDYVIRGSYFGLTVGVHGDYFRFEPYRTVTRGEFITMLGRLHEYAGEPIGASHNAAFYTRYLTWAADHCILQGDLGGDLMPYVPVTREQMAVFIDRYIAAFALEKELADLFLPNALFQDWENCSDWALPSVLAMGNYALMQGDGFTFRPLAHSSRAEALAVLARLGDVIYD